MKILLAEDSASQRSIFVVMLKKLGYEDIVEASDGLEAWQYLAEEDFSLLITDWNMPNLTGFELLERARYTPELAGLPILMVTTVNDQKNIVAAMRAGISSYLTKPFTPPQLKSRIDKALANASAQMGQEAEDILQNGRQYFPTTDAPYILGPLEPGATQRLTQGQDREQFKFIKHIVNKINRLNKDHPDLNLGYCFDEDNKEIVNRLRLKHEKTKALLIWTTPAYEQNGLVMARLVGRNQQEAMQVYLFCDSIADLPTDEFDAIKQMHSVELMEKNDMELSALDGIIEKAIGADIAKPTE